MTGKAFHIYRPLVIDANNDTIWGELNIENSVMSVSVNQDWLNNAVYPVRVDPGFGFAGIGGTSGNLYYNSGYGDKASIGGNDLI